MSVGKPYVTDSYSTCFQGLGSSFLILKQHQAHYRQHRKLNFKQDGNINIDH